jgi:hypothetical protein
MAKVTAYARLRNAPSTEHHTIRIQTRKNFKIKERRYLTINR